MYIVLEYIKYIFLLLLIWVAGYGWSTYGCHKTPADHMEPVLNKGHYAMYQKTPGDLSGINHGDVVVFYRYLSGLDGETVTELTGRVVGLPGDRLKMKSGTLLRNGRERPEPYLDEKSGSASFPLVVVPKNHFFVLADHRRRSGMDSRAFGPIPDFNLLGKVRR